MPIKDRATTVQSRRQEARVARAVGGRLTKASGARAEKGDVRLEGVVRIECKSTKAASFSITREMLQTIREAAAAKGELPAIVVQFLAPDGRRILGEVAVIPADALDAVAESFQSSKG